jgi:acyl-CoA synthetase (NDP forming)
LPGQDTTGIADSQPGVADAATAIDLLYHPRSIGVVGAHDTRAGLSGMTQIALQRAQLTGAQFYPINPSRETVFGHPCYPTVDDAPERMDLLIILTGDPASILDGIERNRPRVVLVFANGFSEVGTDEGRQREERLMKAVGRLEARLVGPNTNANALQPLTARPGPKIALVAQSGHQGAPVRQAQELGVGLSYLAPTGNEADLESSDFIRYFANDADTAVVAAYIEGFTSGDGLRQAAIAGIESGTPTVIVKVGRSHAGATMAQSHTGHLTGEDAVFDAFFQQFGMQRVDDLDELIEVSVCLARSRVPVADGVAVFSVSGGTAAHVADLAKASGLDLPQLSPDTQAALSQLIPAGLQISNPIDNGGPSMADGNGVRMIEAVLADPNIGIVLCPITGVAPMLTDLLGAALLAAAGRTDKAILPIWSGPTTSHPVYDQLWAAGLPVFRNFRNAIRAAHALLDHPRRNPELAEMAERARRLPTLPAARLAGPALDEDASATWLEERGIPFAPRRAVRSVDQAVAAAAELGYPVVVKGLGPAHKSEHGLVALNLADDHAVGVATSGILAHQGVDSVLVARHISGGTELLVGVSTDPLLGPVVVLGAGGVAAEALGDVSRSVLPLTRARAQYMVESLRIAPLLSGWRGAPAADRDAIVDLLLTVGDIAAGGEVAELDINPLLATAHGVVGLDALVRLNDG